MKKLLVFCFVFGLSFINWGQSLSASIILAAEPHCRTAENQSGNGVLIGFASGGMAPYSYTWLDSSLVQFTKSTTAIIKSPGLYYLKVIDANNDMVLDSMEVLDSINPEANFELSSPDFYLTDPYEAYSEANIQLRNLTPPPFILPPFPCDTNFQWTIRNTSTYLNPKQIYPCIGENNIHIVLKDVGPYEICLIAKNFNNCRDTSCKYISLVSPLILDPEIQVAVIPNYASQTVQFHSTDFSNLHTLNIYTVGGKFLKVSNLDSPIQTVDFNYAKGVYVFSVLLGNKLVTSGKFLFGI